MTRFFMYTRYLRTYHYKSDPKFSLNSKLIEKKLKKIPHHFAYSINLNYMLFTQYI